MMSTAWPSMTHLLPIILYTVAPVTSHHPVERLATRPCARREDFTAAIRKRACVRQTPHACTLLHYQLCLCLSVAWLIDWAQWKQRALRIHLGSWQFLCMGCKLLQPRKKKVGKGGTGGSGSQRLQWPAGSAGALCERNHCGVGGARAFLNWKHDTHWWFSAGTARRLQPRTQLFKSVMWGQRESERERERGCGDILSIKWNFHCGKAT